MFLTFFILEPLVIFVLGGPGAGKGTQCAKIVNTFKFVHISAGELLRIEMGSGSEHGIMIDRIIKNGEIVPSYITVGLLKKAMEASETKNFLIDGFPRNKENDNVWQEIIADHVDFGFLLFFDCSEETMKERLLQRGKVSGRTDDNLQSIKKRLNTFKNDTMQIVEHYGKMGKLKKVDGNRTIEEVFDDVKVLFEK